MKTGRLLDLRRELEQLYLTLVARDAPDIDKTHVAESRRIVADILDEQGGRP